METIGNKHLKGGRIMNILYLVMILVILYTIGWVILLPFRLIGSAANNLRLKNAVLKADLKLRKTKVQNFLKAERDQTNKDFNLSIQVGEQERLLSKFKKGKVIHLTK